MSKFGFQNPNKTPFADTSNNLKSFENYKLENSKNYTDKSERPRHCPVQMSTYPHSKPLIGKSVAVILGYFEGRCHIQDQLKSIFDQTHSALHIYLYDDDSRPRFSLDGLLFDQDSLSKISVGGSRTSSLFHLNHLI